MQSATSIARLVVIGQIRHLAPAYAPRTEQLARSSRPPIRRSAATRIRELISPLSKSANPATGSPKPDLALHSDLPFGDAVVRLGRSYIPPPELIALCLCEPRQALRVNQREFVRGGDLKPNRSMGAYRQKF